MTILAIGLVGLIILFSLELLRRSLKQTLVVMFMELSSLKRSQNFSTKREQETLKLSKRIIKKVEKK